MKKVILTLIHLLIIFSGWAQYTLTGKFTALAEQPIQLIGYSGLGTYTIDSTRANAQGEFLLSFNQNDGGMAYLLTEDQQSFIVLLAEAENLQLSGVNFNQTQDITIVQGKQNQLLAQYTTEHRRREQCLSAWDYLTKIYQSDPLFTTQKTPKQAIAAEKKRIQAADSLFLAHLPKTDFISYYLPLRKLIGSVGIIAQYRTAEIPGALAAFRSLDYTDPRIDKSGLLSEALESHVWLVENSGRSLDSVYIELQTSIDRLLENLRNDEARLNLLTRHLFQILEKRSLFQASEYLAIQLLNQQTCTLNQDFAAQLESYRAMKKGNIAPDIAFTGDVFAPAYPDHQLPARLSDIDSDYKVVVFGASWCPHCPSELQAINKHYPKWQQQGVEVLFVALDHDPATFERFTRPFPFISICDYQQWDGQAVEQYHVFATPTIYLLDKQHEILLKANSIDHLKTWIDWQIVKRNP